MITFFIRFLRDWWKHKRYIWEYGTYLRVPYWRLILHDLSQLRPAYAVACIQNIYAENDQYAEAYLTQLHLHMQREKYYWLLWRGEVSEELVAEQVADWYATAKARGTLGDMRQWYLNHPHKGNISPRNRQMIEYILGLRNSSHARERL